MSSLKDWLAKKEFADDKEFKSITDFSQIKLNDVEVLGEREFEYETAEGDKRTYKRVVVKIKGYDGEVFVPISVMKTLKALVEKFGDKLNAFSVIKIGEGKKTKYEVVPYVGAGQD